MFLKKITLAILLATLLAPLSFASSSANQLDLTVFRAMYDIEVPEISLATEVQVYLPEMQNMGVALVENESGQAQATAALKEVSVKTVDLVVLETSALDGSKSSLTDGDYSTVAEFDLDRDAGVAYSIFETDEDLTSSYFSMSLDAHVAWPYSIAIHAYEDGAWSTVLARTSLSSSSVSFPETTASKWKVELWHSQPLRISEMSFTDANASTVTTGEYIVWLARPGEKYTLYSDAAIYASVSTTEGGDLLDDRDSILDATLGDQQENPLFTEPDDDADGIANYLDNCVSIANEDQTDLDANGLGDACEDHDGDNIVDSVDNCPQHANKRQKDTDGDGIGDECDSEESRITEKMPWLPWAAMGLAGLVVFAIVIQTFRNMKEE